MKRMLLGELPTKDKKRTLGKERKFELVKNSLPYMTGDHKSPEPHWHDDKYLLGENPAFLFNNRKTVFLRTRKLSRVQRPKFERYAS